MKTLRNIIFIALIALSALAAQSTTAVVDTIYTQVSNTLFTGDLTFYTSPYVTSDGRYMASTKTTVHVTNGAFSQSFTAGGPTIRVVYQAASNGPSWTEHWAIPVSSTPVAIKDVITTAPSVNVAGMSLAQLAQDGATNSQAIIWNGQRWIPGTVSGGAAATPTIYKQNISAVTTVTVPSSLHQFTSPWLIVKSFDTSGMLVESGNITIDPITLQVTINYATPQSGHIEISSGTSFAIGISAATIATIPAYQHNLLTISAVECVDTTNTIVQSGGIALTPAMLNIGGIVSQSDDVLITFATPQSGKCAVIGS